jgi:hypothetical protein
LGGVRVRDLIRRPFFPLLLFRERDREDPKQNENCNLGPPLCWLQRERWRANRRRVLYDKRQAGVLRTKSEADTWWVDGQGNGATSKIALVGGPLLNVFEEFEEGRTLSRQKKNESGKASNVRVK